MQSHELCLSLERCLSLICLWVLTQVSKITKIHSGWQQQQRFSLQHGKSQPSSPPCIPPLAAQAGSINEPVTCTKVTISVCKSHQQSPPGTEEQQLAEGKNLLSYSWYKGRSWMMKGTKSLKGFAPCSGYAVQLLFIVLETAVIILCSLQKYIIIKTFLVIRRFI